ncbi:TPA: hypothetical protein DEO28_00185 [Candidatus Dependentiae bacterium]|nr:MAG: Ankyrin domain protein ank2 [candidate division TM6 bacterium GW2011_GWE2_31_21]KKP54015.1 MAG: Ankyrin domain protein ank2 [candidate division TM6 bacterium GW2011_GWF2_33_332]HBS48404.1 hypothetical protein [Candidatus Dependentiae bacterium]HBZ72922.1 hypothetical protein [Candidatus Dependentiae bacterium]
MNFVKKITFITLSLIVFDGMLLNAGDGDLKYSISQFYFDLEKAAALSDERLSQIRAQAGFEIVEAIRLGNSTRLELLLRFINPNFNIDADGWTPLHLAVLRGHVVCIHALINAGANIEAKDNEGFTPLHVAAMEGRAECVKVLADAGSNIDVQDDTLGTALHYAAIEGHADCVSALIKAGANIEAQGHTPSHKTTGITPLNMAATFGYVDCVKILIESGANVYAVCKGKTILDFASDSQTKKLLEDYLTKDTEKTLRKLHV